MSFNQNSGKINSKKLNIKKRVSQSDHRKRISLQSIQKYKQIFQQKIYKDERVNQNDIQHSKYTLPWIKKQKQPKNLLPLLKSQKFQVQVSEQKQNVQDKEKSQNSVLRFSIQKQKLEVSKQKNMILQQLKKQLFDPWKRKIKQQEKNIILNYLNGKVKIQKPKRKKKKTKSFFQNQLQSQQFIILPVSDANIYQNSIIPISDSHRYKNSISLYKRKKHNHMNHKQKHQNVGQRQQVGRKQMLNAPNGQMEKQNIKLEEQNKLIQQLRDKVQQLDMKMENSRIINQSESNANTYSSTNIKVPNEKFSYRSSSNVIIETAEQAYDKQDKQPLKQSKNQQKEQQKQESNQHYQSEKQQKAQKQQERALQKSQLKRYKTSDRQQSKHHEKMDLKTQSKHNSEQWKNMERVRLLKLGKNKNTSNKNNHIKSLQNKSNNQLIQIIKPKYKINQYEKSCHNNHNSKQSQTDQQTSIIHKNQFNRSFYKANHNHQNLKSQRYKTEEEVQNNLKFKIINSKNTPSTLLSKHQHQQSHIKPFQSTKRIVYFQKDLGNHTFSTQKNINSYKKSIIDDKSKRLSQFFRQNNCPIHGSSSLLIKQQMNSQQMKQAHIPHRMPNKDFLKLKSYYAQLIYKNFDIQAKKINHSALKTKIIKLKYPLKLIPSQVQLKQFIQQYVSEYYKIKIFKLMHSGNFKILLQPSHQLYFGQIVQNKKSGLGVTIKENYIFQGEYKNGFKIKGIEITEAGKYIGEFRKDKKQGKGQYFYNNGEHYNGEWLNGKKNGNGMWSSENGDHYIGQWLDGRVQGQGVHTTLNGQHYQGSFQHFLKSGWGKQHLPNGDQYEGQFEKGKPHGKGTYKWKQGHVYNGQFVDGLRSNVGILQDYNKNIYKGHFKQQQAFGFCEIKFENRDIYQGTIQNGVFNGRGTLKLFEQKQIWNGYWINDEFIDAVD